MKPYTAENETSSVQLYGSDLVEEINKKVQMILQRIKAAQDHHNKYHDAHHRSLEFNVGDFAYLKVSPMKGVFHFGVAGKLSPRYVGPFEVIEKIGSVTYRLKLHEDFFAIHKVFHISSLRRCLHSPSHIIQLPTVSLKSNLSYLEEPIKILARDQRQLRNCYIPIVKVQWSNRSIEESNWEKKPIRNRNIQVSLTI